MGNQPLPKFHFQVDWGGARMGFTEVSGLDFETEVIEYREGTDKKYNKTKQPGLTKYANITLKRGTFKGDNDYYEWWKTNYICGEKRDITISLLDEEHKPVITWKAISAWPKKVESTDLKASSNDVAIETMELVHEGLVVEHN